MGIWKCRKCNEFLSDEELERHKCLGDLPFKGVKEIPLDHYYEIESKNGEKMVMAWGLDGFLYRLILSPKLAFTPIISSDENLQGHKSDEDFTEPAANYPFPSEYFSQQ